MNRQTVPPFSPDPLWLDFTGFIPPSPSEAWPDFSGYVAPAEDEREESDEA
jgi:hypothetical protein